jgi:hypothetical protein
MGVAFCVVFNKDVPPFGTLGADNMALAKGDENLDAVAQAKGMRTLGSFLSQDPQELAEMMDLDVEEMGAPPLGWFDAAEGLTAVQALIAHLRSDPKAISKATEMLAELEQIESELSAAAKATVMFHFSIVM